MRLNAEALFFCGLKLQAVRLIALGLAIVYALFPLAHDLLVEHRLQADSRFGAVHVDRCEHESTADTHRTHVRAACPDEHATHDCLAALLLRTAFSPPMAPSVGQSALVTTVRPFAEPEFAFRLDHRLAPKASPPAPIL